MKAWLNLVLIAFSVMSGWAHAENVAPKALSETIYVPAYSEVLIGPKNSQQMAITIVVHNIDPEHSINVHVVNYHNHQGKQVEKLLQEAIIIEPFGSWKHLIGIQDKTGGVGANFLISWTSETPVISPIAEALVIGGTGTQGISFTTRGRVIAREIADASQN